VEYNICDTIHEKVPSLSNRNLKTSKALLKSQAHQGTNLFTSAATNQRGVFQRGGQEKLRSNFQNTRRGVRSRFSSGVRASATYV